MNGRFHSYVHVYGDEGFQSNLWCCVDGSNPHIIPVASLQLADILDTPDMESIIAWKPHGRAFVVLNSRKLEKVLPSIFKQSSITSFTRQLNLWNFKRLNRKGEDFKCYYHELFLRGRPRLGRLMRRIRVKGVGTRRASVPRQEPNFYELNLVHPCSNYGARKIQNNAREEIFTVSRYTSDRTRMMRDNQMTMRSDVLPQANFRADNGTADPVTMNNMVTASPSTAQYQSRFPMSDLSESQMSAGGSGVETLSDGRDSELILALRQSLLRPSLPGGQMSTNTQAGPAMNNSDLILALQQQQSLLRRTPLRGGQMSMTDSELILARQMSLLQPTRLGGDQMSTSTQAGLILALQQSLLRPPLPSFSNRPGVQMPTNTQALAGDNSELKLALRQSLLRPTLQVGFQMPTNAQRGSARTDSEIIQALQQSLRQPSSSTASTMFRGQTSSDTQTVPATTRTDSKLRLALQQSLLRPPAPPVFLRPSQNQQRQPTLNNSAYPPSIVNELQILDQIRRNGSHGNQRG